MVTFSLCLAIYVDQRKPMLWSAVMSIPCSLSSFLFVPDYWQPVRIIGSEFGIEDLIFSTATGGMVWLFAVSPFRSHLWLRINLRDTLRRYFSMVGLGVIVLIGTERLNLGPMNEALLGISILAVVIYSWRPDVWPFAVVGSIAFTVIYTVVLLAIFNVYPNMLSQWNTANLWGIFLFGIPFEEIAWACAFGAVWPSCMAYVFDARLTASLRPRMRS